MAARTIAITDTLETFRQQFNALSSQDFGDIANLSGAISSTNLVDAMNETIGIATSTAGFTIEDSSSTQQIIGGGDTLRIFGTSNEIEAVVSATDTLTIGLPNDVTIGNDLTVTNDLGVTNDATVTGSIKGNAFAPRTGTTSTFTGNWTVTGNSTLGTITINGNTIASSDSTEININDSLQVTGTIKGNIETSSITSATGAIDFGSTNLQTTGYMYFGQNSFGLIFEGSTADAFETTLRATDPTADHLILLPNEAGTLITQNSVDIVSESMMADDAIGSAQLKDVQQLILYNSSGTPVKTLYGAGS